MPASKYRAEGFFWGLLTALGGAWGVRRITGKHSGAWIDPDTAEETQWELVRIDGVTETFAPIFGDSWSYNWTRGGEGSGGGVYKSRTDAIFALQEDAGIQVTGLPW